MPRRRALLLTGRAGIREIQYKGKPAFYRVTGYRDSAGDWIARDPENGHFYKRKAGRHKASTPTRDQLVGSSAISIELQWDERLFHKTIDGSALRALGA